jgi:hypothetical protein
VTPGTNLPISPLILIVKHRKKIFFDQASIHTLSKVNSTAQKENKSPLHACPHLGKSKNTYKMCNIRSLLYMKMIQI